MYIHICIIHTYGRYTVAAAAAAAAAFHGIISRHTSPIAREVITAATGGGNRDLILFLGRKMRRRTATETTLIR